MLATRASAPAPTAPSRVCLGPTRLSRAVLDGGWWPRSWDAAAELSNLVPVLSEHYGQIGYVILHGSAWTGRAPKLWVGGRMIRIGWFTSMDAALLVATTDTGDQIDLLVVPPSFPPDLAVRAMETAASPSNVERAPDLLSAAGSAAGAGSALPAGLPESVWDNEGGSAARPSPHDG